MNNKIKIPFLPGDKWSGRTNTFQVKGNEKQFYFEFADMYEAPPLSYALLRKLADFFGTEKIDSDQTIHQTGCETCDHGSKYGYEIHITDATKNNPFKVDSNELH